MNKSSNDTQDISKILTHYVQKFKSNINLDTELFPQISDLINHISLLLNGVKQQKNIETELYISLDNLATLEPSLPHNYSLINGRMGIIYTFLRAYKMLDNEKYLHTALTFFSEKKCKEYISSQQNANGLYQGKTGILIGLIQLNYYTKNLKETITFTFNEILKDLTFDKHGLCNFYPEHSKKTVVNLAQGNAGGIWLMLVLSHFQLNKSLKPVLQSLINSLKGQWNNKTNNWCDNWLKINSIQEHFDFIAMYESKQLNYFKNPKNTLDFWHGGLGISFVALHYLKIYRDPTLLNQVEAFIAKFEKNKASLNTFDKVLLWIYDTLFLLTYKPQYALNASKVLSNHSLSDSDKISTTLYRLNNYDESQLTILPTINKHAFDFKKQLKNLKLTLLIRVYPKTIALVSHLNEKYFRSISHFDDLPLDDSLYSGFEQKIANELTIISPRYKILIKDCLKFEQSVRKMITKHQNKILMKIEDIVQYKIVDDFLNSDEATQWNQKFKIADNVYLLDAKWNWFKRESVYFDEVLNTPPSQFYGLIKVKPNKEQRLILPLSENQVILLETFFESTTISDAVSQFYENFEINNESESKELEKFVEETLEQFVFNRFILKVF